MHIGLADFAAPALLILGDETSLNWLAGCIATRQSIGLATSPLVKLVSVGLVIAPTDAEGSLSRSNTLFNWKVSRLEAQQFAQQLRALAGTGKPAHAYLDPNTNSAGVQVIASQGEYRDAVFIQ